MLSFVRGFPARDAGAEGASGGGLRVGLPKIMDSLPYPAGVVTHQEPKHRSVAGAGEAISPPRAQSSGPGVSTRYKQKDITVVSKRTLSVVLTMMRL